MKDQKGPLARYTVLDLSRVRAGPTAVRQLADWGANVIKIEPPKKIDSSIGMGGPRHGPDFQNLHRNKRGLILNLKTERGRKAFLRLVKKADVVVENFRPEVKERLGIDYATCREENPRVVYASVSGFGQDGPYRFRPGLDQIAQGMGGLMSITGLPGQGPVRVGVPIADLAAGLYTAIGILIALLQRDVEGKGQLVHTSLLEAQIAMLDFQAARWLMGDEVPEQAGNNHPTIIPTGTFQTSDGYINIASGGEQIWQRICEVLSANELSDHPHFSGPEVRSKNREQLNAKLSEYFLQKSSNEWIEELNEAGVPCGPIYQINEMWVDPQVRHLEMSRTVKHSLLGKIKVVRNAANLVNDANVTYRPAPERGEHTIDILREFGFSNEEINALREDHSL